MIGLDTSVICRYLLADDAQQTRRAAEVIEGAEAEGRLCFLSKIVLCELVWVLESCTELARPEIAGTLDRLLRAKQLEIEDRPSVGRALGLYRAGKADFSDYLIGETNAASGCVRTATFDRALAGAKGFEVLKPIN